DRKLASGQKTDLCADLKNVADLRADPQMRRGSRRRGQLFVRSFIPSAQTVNALPRPQLTLPPWVVCTVVDPAEVRHRTCSWGRTPERDGNSARKAKSTPLTAACARSATMDMTGFPTPTPTSSDRFEPRIGRSVSLDHA